MTAGLRALARAAAAAPLALLRAASPDPDLEAPVDAAGLAAFRVLLGVILAYELAAYLDRGLVVEFFHRPAFHIRYWGFGWLPHPADMRPVAGAALAAAAALAIGWRPRLAAAVATLGFGWMFLLERARYLNHHYLVLLLTGIYAAVPAGAAWSVEAWRRGRDRPVPAWTYALLRVQIGLVYAFAAVAKLTPDWLAGLPMANMLRHARDLPVLGAIWYRPETVLAFSWGGLAIDAVAFPGLLYRRTRLPTALALAGFHLTNAAFLDIGIFPWTMLCTTVLFFEPGALREGAPRRFPRRGLGAPRAALAAYVALQVALPLRHWLVPGNPEWHEVGHRFAWRMKLRSRQAACRFFLRDPATGLRWVVDPGDFLRRWQVKKVARDPDSLVQFARFLAAHYRALGRPEVEVRVVSLVSLNRRHPALLVDPGRDLAKADRPFGVPDWVLPVPPGYPMLHSWPGPVPGKVLRRFTLESVFSENPRGALSSRP